MTNKEIANKFQELASLMELHGENKFKIRSYSSAYITLRKQSEPLEEMSDQEIGTIKGVGKAISGKIRELIESGEMETMKKYQEVTPQGIQDMLKIKGFGPKKISVIWKELEVESIGELIYACNENRLVALNGFGQKTQEDLKNRLEYFLVSKNKFHYATLEKDANVLLEKIQKILPNTQVSWVGEMRRACPIVNVMEFLVATDEPIDSLFEMDFLTLEKKEVNHFVAKNKNEKPVTIFTCTKNEYGSKLFRYSSSDEFLKAFIKNYDGLDFKGLKTEEEIFEKADLPFILPELRETSDILDLAKNQQLPKLIEESDIKGVIHSHSTYSDGINSLREMAEYSKKLGYDYLGITDHSQAAFYANGLKEDRVMQQFAEIDALNEELAPFKIFKGIESDILNDGSLDYPTDVLRQFDFIIASVHSNLKMDKEKATNRLLKAIENRYTTILGHPTGRLLLSRKGYPIDHKKIIDACATYGVAIELNSNPYRLDLDWTWIPYALEKGVLISINPDAHSTGGIHDIHFGILPARKGRLTKEMCLNTKTVEEFSQFIAI
jgi:DNA polymerase (family 10)